MNEKKYVIYSLEETTAQDEPLFWNNEVGWTSIEGATIFTKNETERFNLPLPKDSMWIKYNDAQEIVRAYRESMIN